MARWLLFAALALAAAPLAAQQPIPRLTGRVVDLTSTLTSAQQAALAEKLAALEQRKGSQIAVLIVKSTEPEAIEQYSLRVAEAWHIGRGKIDDGIVVVVAKDDRKLKIEVGYGLEGAVPDALAKRIIADRIAPRFAAGDYAGGLNDGVDALIALIDGEPLPPPKAAPRGDRGRGERGDSFGALPFLVFFALFLAAILRRVFGSLFGALAVGAGAGFVVWLLSSVLFLAFAAGAVVFVLALAGVTGGPGRWSSGGGYWGGRGGFGGGFGGGGGGFSGGGGRFGGGGASGGW